MDRTFENIINEGKAAGKSYAEINEELKAAGANFHLDPDGTKSGWTEQEMQEGFLPAETEAQPLKKLHEYMKYDPNKAGTEETVTTAGGVYRITWDEMGHPTKAVRV